MSPVAVVNGCETDANSETKKHNHTRHHDKIVSILVFEMKNTPINRILCWMKTSQHHMTRVQGVDEIRRKGVFLLHHIGLSVRISELRINEIQWEIQCQKTNKFMRKWKLTIDPSLDERSARSVHYSVICRWVKCNKEKTRGIIWQNKQQVIRGSLSNYWQPLGVLNSGQNKNFAHSKVKRENWTRRWEKGGQLCPSTETRAVQGWAMVYSWCHTISDWPPYYTEYFNFFKTNQIKK